MNLSAAKYTGELTPRNQEVYDLLVEGKTYDEIAKELIISYTTVKTHINIIFQKKFVHSRAELIALHWKECSVRLKNQTVILKELVGCLEKAIKATKELEAQND